MAELSLAFLWHQHQPFYPGAAGDNPMPWVRLHGVKDYFGMALHLLEFPEMRCTINLVPSLLTQIEAYTHHGASDRPLDATRMPAAHLSEADAVYILDHFFMANHEHMIRPFPRYYELLQRRNAAQFAAADVVRRFNERDLLDLQVLFNLAWIHPLAFERDTELRELRDRGRHFTEEDKTLVIAKQFEILAQIIPLHRRLQDSGQVELTTTPYYHPILPLLFDKKLARQSVPAAKLPRFTGGYPDDADVHVRRAVEAHAKTFGSAPRGMWPAEGSVCQEMIPLLVKHGIEWIATDEGVLGQSTQGFVCRDDMGHVVNPSHLFRPYRVREGDASLSIVFRDHALSDMIGFCYQRSDGALAADDFLGHLNKIRESVGSDRPALVSVILDGENCWEHYPGGGVPFLRALYERCTKTPGIRPVRLGDALRDSPPKDELPRLAAGSWINHNLAIWIGHDEDNTAWDLLHATREHLVGKSSHPLVTADQRAHAWEEIYIAEGSDWFWWFGDDHSSLQDALFDSLFRQHLKNVYTILGDEPPAELSRPIKRRRQRLPYTLPTAFLDVTIDGQASFIEWFHAGRFVCHGESGTMAMTVKGPMSEILFGFSPEVLIVRIDFDRPARQTLAEFDELRIGFTAPRAAELVITHPGRTDQSLALIRGDVASNAIGVQLGIDKVAEASIPFDLLGAKVGDPVHFYVDLRQARQSRDRAPRESEIHLERPSDAFESLMWNA